ncbi:MAG: PA2169 family four-helix-bundle protein [Fimbriimonadaceae bacterium]|nr:PA2169 family four-helix-bundle protein [Chitinophagales bacterium]
METKINEKRIAALNDLIRINNDRYDGYNTAAKESKHGDLDSIFLDYAQKSRGYATKLSQYVREAGGTPEEGTTTSGKFYRAWMDVKAALTGKDRKAILSSCEFGEDVALKTYDAVIETTDLNFPKEVLDTIFAQKSELKIAHDRIKELRDSEKEVEA